MSDPLLSDTTFICICCGLAALTIKREEPEFGNGWVADCDHCLSGTSIRNESINLFLIAVTAVETRLTGCAAFTKAAELASGKVPESISDRVVWRNVLAATLGEPLAERLQQNSTALAEIIRRATAAGKQFGSASNAQSDLN